MGIPKEKDDKIYSYADYREFPEGRWELVQGEAYAMSPAPTFNHQRVVQSLAQILGNYLEGKTCEVVPSPVDVRLPESSLESDEEILTVVQPDLVVVCDPDQIDDAGVKGGPAVVVEVLSEATGGRDLTVKLDLYERHGVKEFWVVHPTKGWMNVFRRTPAEDEFEAPLTVSRSQVYTTPLFPGLEVSMEQVFRRVKV